VRSYHSAGGPKSAHMSPGELSTTTWSTLNVISVSTGTERPLEAQKMQMCTSGNMSREKTLDISTFRIFFSFRTVLE